MKKEKAPWNTDTSPGRPSIIDQIVLDAASSCGSEQRSARGKPIRTQNQSPYERVGSQTRQGEPDNQATLLTNRMALNSQKS